LSVWTVRDGRLVRWLGFTDRPEALEAAGLSESAMSQANVEIVRRMYDAWKRGDFEVALSYIHSDVQWSEPPDNPGARTWSGHEGVRGALTTWMGAWEDFRYEIRELIDCGDDRVLLSARQTGRGKGSGIEISEENFSLYEVREGKIVNQRMFRHRAEALEAAGLAD
jgi:ketosteroid isomerase-like protein